MLLIGYTNADNTLFIRFSRPVVLRRDFKPQMCIKTIRNLHTLSKNLHMQCIRYSVSLHFKRSHHETKKHIIQVENS